MNSCYIHCKNAKYIIIYTVSSDIYDIISNKNRFYENYLLYPYSSDYLKNSNLNESVQLVSYPLITKKTVIELVKDKIMRISSLSFSNNNKIVNKIFEFFSDFNDNDYKNIFENLRIIISKIDDEVIYKYVMSIDNIGEWVKYKEEIILKSDLENIVSSFSSNFIDFIKKYSVNCLDNEMVKNSNNFYVETHPIYLYIYWDEVEENIKMLSGSPMWKSCSIIIKNIIDNLK